MAVRIQIRRDTTQNWYELNPILADGEIGIEQLDDKKVKLKIGNGVDRYADLEYFADTISYPDVINKPTLNGMELVGDMTLADLGIQPIGSYVAMEDLVNGLALKADIDNTYNKYEVDTFFANLIKIPDTTGVDDKYLKIKDGELLWSNIEGDIVSVKKLEEELEKKVDVTEGYSLVSNTEILRLADVDNYDDSEIKEDLQLLKEEVDTKATINQLESFYVSTDTFENTLNNYAKKADISSKANASELATHTANTLNPHKVTKAQIGLGNVNNTSDIEKPISVATQTALNTKQDKMSAGYGISIEDNIVTNILPNVQADWNAEEGSSMIVNKPVLSDVALSGSYNDLSDLPYIPTDYELPIATSETLGGVKIGEGFMKSEDGTISVHDAIDDYNELLHRPSIGGIVLIEGQTAEDLDLATAKATQSELNLKADKVELENYMLKADMPNVPTKVSELENDKGFIENIEYVDFKNEISNEVETERLRAMDIEGTLAQDVVKKADQATTYTKAEIDKMLSAMYVYKGSVATFEELPATDNNIGDVWNVADEECTYAWNGNGWDKMGSSFDLSGYLTITEAELKYAPIINENSQVYATNNVGQQRGLAYAIEANALSLAYRNDRGTFEVTEPIKEEEVTNKKYVGEVNNELLNYTNEQLELKADKETTYTKSDINDILANIDYVIESKLPTAEDPTWYRLYKSGWIEQGGKTTIAVSTGSVKFMKEMGNNFYTCILDMEGNANEHTLSYNTPTTTGFNYTIRGANGYANQARIISWEVKGYVA